MFDEGPPFSSIGAINKSSPWGIQLTRRFFSAFEVFSSPGIMTKSNSRPFALCIVMIWTVFSNSTQEFENRWFMSSWNIRIFDNSFDSRNSLTLSKKISISEKLSRLAQAGPPSWIQHPSSRSLKFVKGNAFRVSESTGMIRPSRLCPVVLRLSMRLLSCNNFQTGVFLSASQILWRSANDKPHQGARRIDNHATRSLSEVSARIRARRSIISGREVSESISSAWNFIFLSRNSFIIDFKWFRALTRIAMVLSGCFFWRDKIKLAISAASLSTGRTKTSEWVVSVCSALERENFMAPKYWSFLFGKINPKHSFIQSTIGFFDRKLVRSRRGSKWIWPRPSFFVLRNNPTSASRNLYIDCMGSPTINMVRPSPGIQPEVSFINRSYCLNEISWYSSTRICWIL